MFAFRCKFFMPYCITLSSLLLFSACDNARNPPLPTDPGNVARRVVAEFLSLPITDVILVSLEAQDFNDSSLGCPEPGMAYQQVITPGYRASVEADGRRFDVRIAGGHGRICRNGKRGGTARQSSRESAVSHMADLARSDLAGLLGVGTSMIRVLDIRPYDGKNPPTGCAPQCADGDKSCGYIIGLLYDERRYDYHTVGDHAVACPPILRL